VAEALFWTGQLRIAPILGESLCYLPNMSE
jgi:hypothetical protein